MSVNILPKFLEGVNLTGIINKFARVIQNTKTCKNLTKIERYMFQSYMDAKPFMIGITPDEIKQLDRLDDKDFVFKSFDFLAAKLGLGTDIRPRLQFHEILGMAEGMYDWLNNTVIFDSNKIKKCDRIDVFGMIRHELQHYIQRMNILRHEQIAPKAVRAEIKIHFEYMKKMFEHICKCYSESEFYNIAKVQNPYNSELLRESFIIGKKCLENNDINGFNKICKKHTGQYHKNLLMQRYEMIKKFGLIKKDSMQTPKIENDFKEFYNLTYKKPDGNIDNIKYIKMKIENEACSAQDAAGFEYSQEQCFMHYAKKNFLRWLEVQEDSSKVVNEIPK